MRRCLVCFFMLAASTMFGAVAIACDGSGSGSFDYVSKRAKLFFEPERNTEYLTKPDERMAQMLDQRFGPGNWVRSTSVRLSPAVKNDEEAPDMRVPVRAGVSNTDVGELQIEFYLEAIDRIGTTNKSIFPIRRILKVTAQVDKAPTMRTPLPTVFDYLVHTGSGFGVNVRTLWVLAIREKGAPEFSESMSLLSGGCGGWGAYSYKDRKLGSS